VSSSTDKLWKFEISIFLKQAIYYIKLFSEDISVYSNENKNVIHHVVTPAPH